MPADPRTGLTVYGLKTCDTCRKARRWLDGNGIAYTWVDVRDDGVPEARLRRWAASETAADLLNRRSTTWRSLDDAERSRADSDLAGLLGEHPTLIKRPVFERGERLLGVGFTAEIQAALEQQS
ncbi:Spx/MgsR family RNA polymerase-binding regulatory protein [Elongatibacter sediminis]|uniref:Spx/MgsR family RNA polymerase-binding regulatory protein n=1 Tax=Elongatibacter sediminis TaxID=3119006 RepID=A0AAW9RLH0_9GAMM